MRKSALIMALILVLSLMPVWSLKPVAAATYIPLVELNQNFDSYAYGGDVLTRGIVTYVDSNGFMIQNGTGAYTGIYVYTGYKSYPSVQPGDVVEVYGYPKYYNGLRELSVSPSYGEYYSVVGTAEVPQPAVIPTADYDRPEYQSVLVKFVDAKITGRYDSWYTKLWIDDGSGEAYIFSSSSLPSTLEPGAKFKYFVGVVYIYRNSYEVLPVEYQLYNPAVKVTDVEYYAFMEEVPTRVRATVFNSGSTASNVSFSATFDGVQVYSTEFTLLPGESKVVEFYVVPQSTGSYTLTIIAEESEKIVPVNVIPTRISSPTASHPTTRDFTTRKWST
ncbi:CARDB domain-containing protein [Thermococcus thermotolerans]|uniref:CARDB domain-containing protein n=1 Tax=Thermococcus thermotolerans TaxID=2969672 RepID=UPI002157A046|nr:CARDB domain-containing protein [Thermococcus thermotolerans]